MAVTIADALLSLRPLPGLAVLMCGVAGSGKTAFAMALEEAGFLRLSIDEEVWRRHGRYGVDFPADAYPALLEPVRAWLRSQVGEAVRSGQAVVIDSSFWSRTHRDEFKAEVERAGGRWRLIYLHAQPELLQRRLANRREQTDLRGAIPVDDAMLARFLRSFQAPVGEGETTVTVA